MQKQYSIIINAATDKTFDCLNSRQKIDEWMHGQMKTDYKTAADFTNPVGIKFHQDIAGIIGLDGEVLAFKKPLELGIGIEVASLKGTIFYELKYLNPNHTQLLLNFELFDATTTKKIILNTMMPLFNRLIHGHLEAIKQLAEE